MIEALLYFTIYIVVIGLVAWLLTYLVDAIPLQEPFRRIAKIAIMVISVLALIILLLGLIGVGGPMPRLGR